MKYSPIPANTRFLDRQEADLDFTQPVPFAHIEPSLESNFRFSRRASAKRSKNTLSF
jgi:hypothetical protein